MNGSLKSAKKTTRPFFTYQFNDEKVISDEIQRTYCIYLSQLKLIRDLQPWLRLTGLIGFSKG